MAMTGIMDSTMTTADNNIVSLEEWKKNHPPEAILEILDEGRRIMIVSPDYKQTYLDEKYQDPIHPIEFDSLVSYWKHHHPDTLCIDF